MAEPGARRWLLVGALPSETAPILARLRRPRPRGLRLVEGAIELDDRQVEVAVLTCGPGPARALAATRAALARCPAEVVLSLGTCGALIAGLGIGDLLCGLVATDGRGRRWPLTPLPGLPALPIATVGSVVADPATRNALARAGNAVCEMEAAAVAEAAQGRRMHALKVVSDLAGAAPDPVHDATLAPSPAQTLRFHARALALSRATLTPALVSVLNY